MIHLLLAIIYLSFISLGLPDALLGGAWPTMQQEFGVSVSWAGGISAIICAGTVISSLLSDQLTRRLGTGAVTAISVGLTAAALLGFSFSSEYWMLCLWAIPYGLGAGSVDACLNNYVALHYASRHMSWLHCMWGVGASTGPYILGAVLTGGLHWGWGYRIIGLMQIILTAALLMSLPLWKNHGTTAAENTAASKPKSMGQLLKIPGAREVMVAFFCYCALEQTAGLWASSYLVLHFGIREETAAFLASLFFLGITAGRAVSGFLTYKMNDTNMIRLGQAIVVLGIGLMALPFGSGCAMAGLLLIGLGCAPIYPCVIHSTPEHFGAENSQALIGIQMASAYLGVLVMPPVFGILANHIHITLLIPYLVIITGTMIYMCERLNRKTALPK